MPTAGHWGGTCLCPATLRDQVKASPWEGSGPSVKHLLSPGALPSAALRGGLSGLRGSTTALEGQGLSSLERPGRWW